MSKYGFEMERHKVEAIADWKRPMNVKGVRLFIGFINFYRQFIQGFSELARPLHDLTRKDVAWKWGHEEERAFEELKIQVSQAPILIHADPKVGYVMETDASNFAYGAILSQRTQDG